MGYPPFNDFSVLSELIRTGNFLLYGNLMNFIISLVLAGHDVLSLTVKREMGCI